jgi:L-alanine-DL-glutamate epimerase-like enolase superfamily enzyme
VRIERVETVWHPRFGRYVWVRIHTDAGLVGLGEVGHNALAAEPIVHDYARRFLLGADPRRIDHLWTTIYDAMRVTSPAGSELRALAAVDVALWDLLGQVCRVPIYQLLGGASRESIPIYNTCIGQEPIPDHRRFHDDAGALAAELLAEGIGCMKVWPFDPFARASHGQYLSAADLERGLATLRAIREGVGERIGIAVELHGYWNLPCALQIARALEPYKVQWVEEAISPESVQAQAEFARASPVPVVSGERIYTRFGLRALLELGGAHIVNPDLTWTGGIGELKRMATMAEAYRRPIKPHNEGGPVHHVASAHVAANVPNLYLLETIRFNYRHVFPQLVEGLPEVVRSEGQARLALPTGPGLGVRLKPELLAHPEVRLQYTDTDGTRAASGALRRE